ncbi:MAG: precorrin-6A synthase (deacetylating) [Pseudomonadota bacterium]
MIEHLWLVGIGTGSPDHITLEGQQALRDAAVVLVPRKGPDKSDLADIRRQILDRAAVSAKVLYFDMPVRDDDVPYQDRVSAWHDAIALAWLDAISGQSFAGPVALLVWGDPGLYDSTLRIADRLSPAPQVRVVPGVTALQALTAAHCIPFNTVNGPVTVTTGRRLRDHGWPDGADTVVIMLDGTCAFSDLKGQGITIWWGAFLGMDNQVLRAGALDDVCDDIIATRANARADHGWIMDTYLMRQTAN